MTQIETTYPNMFAIEGIRSAPFVGARPVELERIVSEFAKNPGAFAMTPKIDGESVTFSWSWTGGPIAAIDAWTMPELAWMLYRGYCPIPFDVVGGTETAFFIRRRYEDEHSNTGRSDGSD